ncbi:MAG: tetratricopeptide repeat protein [Candidatus Cryptobacteroides sp.]
MMKTIKIFLASSDELLKEREMMGDLANSLNTVLERQGINVILVKWENLDASMGVNHKQEDYNEKLRDCDICMAMYWTKFGMYTKNELDTAFSELKAGHNPKKIYVYFKNVDDVKPTDELEAFRISFPKEYGHFTTPFSNLDTLKANFLLQFMEYLGQTMENSSFAEIRNGKVYIDGKEHVNIENIPFVGNNEEYNNLKKEIKDIQDDMAAMYPDSPRYSEKAKILLESQEKLQKMESSLWDTALMITRLSAEKCSDRLRRAMDLFSAGDNKGAQAVLNEEEIEKNINHNLNLIKLGEEGRQGLITNIKELRLKIKTVENEMPEGWDKTVKGLYDRVLDLTGQIYGDDSPEYADVCYEYADCLLILGRAKESLQYIEQSWNIRVDVYGENSLAAVESLIGMGEDQLSLCEYAKAMDNLNRSVAIIRSLDETHSKEYAEAINSLGVVCVYMADYEKAEHCFKEALKLHQTLFGLKNNETIKSLMNLSSLYRILNRFDLAQRFASGALENSLVTNGERSFVTARIMSLMSSINMDVSRYEDARKLEESALSIRRSLFGDYHPDTSHSLNNLGLICKYVGDHQSSMEYWTKVLSIDKEIYGEDHLVTSTAYSNIAMSFFDFGKHSKAIDFMNKALAIRINLLGEFHPEVANIYRNISLVYMQIGEYEKALKFSNMALNIYMSKFGEQHLSTAAVFLRLGDIYGHMARYEECISYELKALGIRGKLLPEKHSAIARTYHGLGQWYYKMGKYPAALENLSKSLEIRLSLFGKVHDDTLESYEWLGDLNLDMKEYQTALDYGKEALSIAEELGKKQAIARCHNRVGRTLAILGRNDEAISHFEKSIQILPLPNNLATDSQARIDKLHKQNGK